MDALLAWGIKNQIITPSLGISVMHDIKWIRDNPEAFDRALARRGLAPEASKLIEIDEHRRAAIGKAEAAQARRNAASKEIGEAKKKQGRGGAAKDFGGGCGLEER